MYFRNDLAEPGITGISAGATLGAVSSQLITGAPGFSAGITASGRSVFAFLGALTAGILICIIARASKNKNPATVLLFGTAAGTFYAAVSSSLLLINSRQLNGIYTWILGSFNGRGWEELKFISFPAAAAVFILIFTGNKLELMACGEDSAETLGLNIHRLQAAVLLSASLAVSSAVCAGGTINFIGLIAPHIIRRISGLHSSKGRFLIGTSMIIGAILVVLSDSLARIIIAPSEIPAGLITSFLGAPFFITLIFKKNQGN